MEISSQNQMDYLSIHTKEDALFEEWPGHDDDLFCFDGLHHTGHPSKESEFWTMEHDNEEEQKWFESPIRCLFLTKDHNRQGDDEGVDVRDETGLDNNTNKVYYRFYARYLILLYGLMHINIETFDPPSLEVAKNVTNYLEYFHKAPVVRINTKKIAGEKSCSASVLANYLRSDYDFIKHQIGLYDANVFVVCQGDGWNIESDHSIIRHILDMLYNQYPDMKKWSDDIYYSKITKTVFLHEWHPSNRVSYKKYYEGAFHVAEFLQKHPDYLRHRKN